MATRITFAAQRGENPLTLDVQESVEDLFAAWTAAHGHPVPLTNNNNGERVYVNPTTVGFWREAPGAPPVKAPG